MVYYHQKWLKNLIPESLDTISVNIGSWDYFTTAGNFLFFLEVNVS